MVHAHGRANGPQDDLAILEFAADQCGCVAMQTPVVIAAMARIGRDSPEVRDDLTVFWHALQLRRPAARRHDAVRALHSIRRLLAL